jgi:hypothetical protein
MTTVGNSQAIRFEKSFFQALKLPTHSPVRFFASILSQGQILLSVERPDPEFEETESPYLEAYLSFIEKSFLAAPEERLVPMTEETAAAAKCFADAVPAVSDDEEFPDDVL